jgi:2-oxoglutarate ferredoxin oxidoreductase subunit beta
MKTKTTPDGNLETPLDPMTFALTAGATFVARGFSGDVKHLQGLIKRGIQHKGFSFIDVFSPCVTFNKTNTYEFFRSRVYKLDESGHDPKNFTQAYEKAREWGDKIPIGVLYEIEASRYEERDPVLKTPLIDHPTMKITPEILKEFT